MKLEWTRAQSLIFCLVVVAIGLQLADAITTIVYISSTHTESNRLLNLLSGWMGLVPAVIAAKTLCVAAILMVFVTWMRARDEMPPGPYLFVFGGLNAVMAFVVLNNIR